MNPTLFGLNLLGIGLLSFPSYLLIRLCIVILRDPLSSTLDFNICVTLLTVIALAYVVLIVNCVYFFEQDRGKNDE